MGSVASEREFKAASEITDTGRPKLLPENEERLLFSSTTRARLVTTVGAYLRQKLLRLRSLHLILAGRTKNIQEMRLRKSKESE